MRAVRRSEAAALHAFVCAACLSAACSSTSARAPAVTETSDSGAASDSRQTDTESLTPRWPDGGRGTAVDCTASEGTAPNETSVGNATTDPTLAAPASTQVDSSPTAASGSDGGAPPPDTSGPLWLFSLAAEGRLHNVRAPSQRVTGVVDANQASPDARPWSKSGKRFAQATSSGITVYDLAADLTQRSAIALTAVTGVLRWIGDDRILASGAADDGPRLWVVGIDGAVQTIGTTTQDAFVAFHSLAPDASALVYSSPDDAGAYVTRSLLTSSEAAPTTLGTYHPSPMLSATWSPNSHQLAFGISGLPDGGFYLWENAAAAAPTRVSPEGAGYTPFLGFSRSGDHLAFVSSSSEGAVELRVISTHSTNQSSVLSAAANLAPQPWGPEEWLAYSNEAGGHLAQLQSAAPHRELELPDYSATCPLVWTATDELVFVRCDTDNELIVASLGQTVELTDVGIASGGLLRVGTDECLLTWSNQDLRLLQFGGATLEHSAVPASMPAYVTVAASGAGVAWSEGDRVRWATVADCQFTAPPALVDAHPADVQALEFLPTNAP